MNYSSLIYLMISGKVRVNGLIKTGNAGALDEARPERFSARFI